MTDLHDKAGGGGPRADGHRGATGTAAMFAADTFPAFPYPGARPACSFVQAGGDGHPVVFADGCWRLVEGSPLDDWLARAGAAPTGGGERTPRFPVLAYGSNANPTKIAWLVTELGLPEPVIVLRARTSGLSAVWAAGRRVVDDQRPATLMAAAGADEEHAVWLATPEQVRTLDRCEGRGVRYDLAEVRTGAVRLESGAVLERPLAYVARAPIRHPLLVEGRPVRCADLGQATASTLTGIAATGTGLALAPPPAALRLG